MAIVRKSQLTAAEEYKDVSEEIKRRMSSLFNITDSKRTGSGEGVERTESKSQQVAALDDQKDCAEVKMN